MLRYFIPATLLTAGFTLLAPLTVLAQQRTYTTSRLTGTAPEIDGKISEPAWESAPWEGDFTQREPADGMPPSEATEFKIIYDDEALYVALRAFDSHPELIDRRLTRRDDTDGDIVGIQIDSYYDRRTAFTFLVNAGGVKFDFMNINDVSEDYTWDPVWYVEVSVDSLGWVAEMKIPYTQLRFAKLENYTWGLNIARLIYRYDELSMWNPIPMSASGWVSQFGDLNGISGINPKKEVELLPYLMGKVELYEEEAGNPYADGTDFGYNAGLDGKVAVTNDLTMNFTINPDFGQVEADPSVVNLTAFETFYKEKRPFFVEGNNIYNFRLTGGDGSMAQDNLFYSRRIGRRPHFEPETDEGEYMKMPENTTILGAFKLSGKTRNGWSVGIMESVTQEESAKISEEGEERKEVVEPWTNYYNTRLQKDFKQGQTILGGMFTATNRFISDSTLEYLPDAAYTGGLDFTNYWKDRVYYLRIKGAFSYVSGTRQSITGLQENAVHNFQRPDAGHLDLDTNLTSLAGHGGILEFGKQGGGHWSYVFWLTWRSPGLDLNDMGYLRQGDILQQVIWAGYKIFEPKGIFRELNVNFNQYSGWDFGGNYIYNGLNTNMNTSFTNYWGAGAGVEYEFPGLDRYELRGGPAIKSPGGGSFWVEVSSDDRKKLNAEIGTYNRWGQYQSDQVTEFWMGLNYRPVNALQLSIQPNYSLMMNELKYVETVEFSGQDEYIMGRIDREMVSANIRINLNITPDLTLQYWGQPFVFAADFSDYKKAADTHSDDYYSRFTMYSPDQISLNEEEDVYYIDENLDGLSDYSFENPDFKVSEFRSNLVVRWEYIPGSTLYFVWSQGRMNDTPNGQFRFPGDYGDLFAEKAHNIFLLKFSYRISI
jgi:hypothetical protein